MCEYCHYLIGHHPRCPAYIPKVIAKCDMCGAELYAGDLLLHGEYEKVCDSCMRDYMKDVFSDKSTPEMAQLLDFEIEELKYE